MNKIFNVGWLFALGARKRHYIKKDRHSLCGKWSVFGGSGDSGLNVDIDDPDNCKKCGRRLKKILAMGKLEADE